MGWRDWFGRGAHTTDDLMAEAEAARVASARVASTPQKTPPPADPKLAIDDLIRRGKKIDAIKLYRETYGTGLGEAKDAVEAMASGRTPAPPPPAATPASDDVVLKYIDEGKLIDAIKAYRELHGTGLKESKDAVERLATQRAAGDNQR